MEHLWHIVLVVVPSYCLGAIPSSYIVGRLFKGIDLREHGSRNLGAANTYRVLGPRSAVPVLLFDILKGFVAVRYFAGFGGESFVYPILAALVVVIGHNYSIFVRFAGGKGVATTAGAFLALAPYAVAICVLLWIICLLLFRIVSVASLVGAIALPPAIIAADRLFGGSTHVSVLVLAVVTAVLVIYKHRSNIGRLIRGEEGKLFGSDKDEGNRRDRVI